MKAPRDGVWLAATLALLVAWAVVRQAANPHLTPDDAFFLDAGRRWLASGAFSMGLWGDAFGHSKFLASYPPGPALVAAADVWAMRVLHTVLAAKITGLVLLVASGVLFWRALRDLVRPPLRAALVVAATLDPCSTTAFFSLRPEAMLLPLVLAVFVLLLATIEGRPGARGWLLAATVALALTHWQFAPTVACVVAVLIVSARRGRVSAAFAAISAVVVAATYGGWTAFVALSPGRMAAVRAQLFAPVGAASWLTRAKMLVGTVAVENLDAGSSAAVWLILATIVLLVQVGRWRRRPAGEMRGHPMLALVFIAASIAPAALLPYVGPRDVPIAFVTAWLLVDWVARGEARTVLAWAPLATAINLAADVALRTRYLDQPWSEAVLTPSWIWCAIAVAAWVLARRGLTAWSLRLPVAAVLTAAAVAALASAVPSGPRATDANVEATAADLAPIVPRGARVLGDSTLHYLPVLALDSSAQPLDLFPVFYATSTDAAVRVLAGERPDVVLLSERNAGQIRGVQPGGAVVAAALRDDFIPRGSFNVDGYETRIFVRRTR